MHIDPQPAANLFVDLSQIIQCSTPCRRIASSLQEARRVKLSHPISEARQVHLSHTIPLHTENMVVLVTGGTLGGLGTEFASTIAKHDPKLVILTARTQAKLVLPTLIHTELIALGSTSRLPIYSERHQTLR